MIKRLKWNVLYAEGAQDGSDLSDSSTQSVERGTATAQAVLDQLATNDPNFATILDQQSDPSSSDEEDTRQTPAVPEEEQLSADSDDAEYAEWRECDLCPDKRFLNDVEVQAHLSSRRHARALKRFEALSVSTKENNEKPAPGESPVNADIQAFARLNSSAERKHSKPSSSPRLTDKNHGKPPSSREVQETQQPEKADQANAMEEPEITEEQQRKSDKRKAAVKRRLRRLKQKKWEKKAQDKGVLEATMNAEEKQTPNTITSENGLRTQQRREKAGKGRFRQEKQEAQNEGDGVDAEGSPSLQKKERKKRNKRKGKEVLREREVGGSATRKRSRKDRKTRADGDVDQ